MVKTFAKVAVSAAVASLSRTALSQEVEFGLEEVVVTAQKRTESLQDVPISVTAIGRELIQDASIRSFSELGAYVPNFSVSENPVNTIITMRGISIGANQSFEQSVGLFLDGVYMGRARQSRIGLFDLEQVEVLRRQAWRASEIGYDGVMVSEHHADFPGYLPNPVQLAGLLLDAMPTGWVAPCPMLLPLKPYALIAEDLAEMIPQVLRDMGV